MRTFFAFTRKEWKEYVRSGRALILLLIFLIIGIMSPAIAKLTPWMMEAMADSLEESGFILTEVKVDAMTSWVQFFKNIPMGMIAFILLCSSIFTKEYQQGTMVSVLTKGFARSKVVLSKSAVLICFWTVCFWMSYMVTWGYNAYFWDNDIVPNLFSAAFFWWLFGLWTIVLMIFFSVLGKSGTTVLAGTGSIFLASYLLGLFAKLKAYMPTRLMDAVSLMNDVNEAEDYKWAAVIAAMMIAVCMGAAVAGFRKKKM